MKLIDLKLAEFIEEIDQKSPTPGGGSVSALVASMGIALSRMAGHLTIDKKKFLALDSSIQFEFKDILAELKIIKEELIKLVDEDTEAFNLVMQAYKLPKDTEVEMSLRNQKIEEGTLEAIRVPLKVATLSLSALHQFDAIVNYSNVNTISDVGVAILMLSAGGEGACMNVMINLSALHDEVTKEQYANQVLNYRIKLHETRDRLLALVYQKLN